MATELAQPISELHQISSADITKPIDVLPGLTVHSSESISKHHGILLRNPKIQHKIQSSYRKSARRALSFARAVRATLQAKENHASKHIDEMEEYLGLLRAKRTMIQLQVSEAEEQVGMVLEALNSNGIAEVSLSDDEYPSASFPPRFSDHICPEDLGSDVESNAGTSTSYNSDYESHETLTPAVQT